MQPNYREQSPVQQLRTGTVKQSSFNVQLQTQSVQSGDQTMDCIWECFKGATVYQCPTSMRPQRNNTVKLMIECHRIMKLPAETLYLSVSILDKILNSNFQLSHLSTGESINVNLLGIACLYSCQKLQKIRNYGVSHWLKHLSTEVLIGMGYSDIILSGECLKKYEAYILERTNYNIYSITTFDILMSIWAAKIPTERQFYFSQLLLELCLFVDFPNLKIEQNNHTNTASSVNEQIENLDIEDNDKYSHGELAIDVALAIACLCFHFFKKSDKELQQLIKYLWVQLTREENQKEFELKKAKIKIMSNIIFIKMMNIDLDNNCQSIKAKFSKQVNMAVLGLKFNQIKGTKRPNKIERIE